jgi:hypothetical protein
MVLYFYNRCQFAVCGRHLVFHDLIHVPCSFWFIVCVCLSRFCKLIQPLVASSITNLGIHYGYIVHCPMSSITSQACKHKAYCSLNKDSNYFLKLAMSPECYPTLWLSLSITSGNQTETRTPEA